MMAAEKKKRPAWVVPSASVAGTLLAVLVFGFGPTLIIAGIAAAALGIVAFGGKNIRVLSTTVMKAGAIGAGVVLVAGGSAAALPAPQASLRTFAELPSTAAPEASPPAPTAAPEPVITTKRDVVTEAIPFATVTQDDPALDVGVTALAATGVNGERTLTYRVVYTDGVETSRELLSDVITVAPRDEVTAIGIRTPPPPKPAPVAGSDGCDPNYDSSWACVPTASDVDCAGGSGNGPAYVRGPVRVIGSDIYDLDRDGDGIGCD